MSERFSKRHGLAPTAAEISVRHDAPHELRGVLVDIAYKCGMRPKPLRQIVCAVLMKRADDSNWSDFPNVDQEIRQLLDDAEWFEIYDVVEAIWTALAPRVRDIFPPREHGESPVDEFARDLNDYLIRRGIGWKLVDGEIEVRGPQAFELAAGPSVERLGEAGLNVAAGELHEALRDLARRPEPDLTGAIQHALASLECVARTASGEKSATLGEILKRHVGLVPAPLDEGLKRMWGYGSDTARHVREGTLPSYAEAELVVLTCAAVAVYLEKVLAGSGDV